MNKKTKKNKICGNKDCYQIIEKGKEAYKNGKIICQGCSLKGKSSKSKKQIMKEYLKWLNS